MNSTPWIKKADLRRFFFVLLMIPLMADAANAKGGDKTEVRARFQDVIETRARGHADYEARDDEERFTATLKLPRNTVPAVTRRREAKALVLTLLISSGGTPSAQCTFVYDNEQENIARYYEYKIDFRERDGSLRKSRGACDVDLAQDGIQLGVPVLESTTTVTVSEPSVGVFLSN